MSEPGAQRPLFSQVGRTAAAPARAGRLFNLLVVLGLVVAVGAFLAELGARPAALRFVEVDMSARPEAPQAP